MRRRAAARQGARAQPHDDRADQVLPLPRGAAQHQQRGQPQERLVYRRTN